MDFSKLTQQLDQLSSKGIPGIDLLVYYKGEPVYRHMTGTCDYLKEKPVTEDTLYWIYSMTKPITMTAVMQCVERGLIRLDDPVCQYLPAFTHMKVQEKDGTLREAKGPILVRHLMSMTSGMSYNFDNPALLEAQRDPEGTTETLVNAMAKDPLWADPGTKYRYSFSHDVAARVVEVATGQRFGEYLQQNIFDPLGMKDTTFRAEDVSHRCRMAAQWRYNGETKTSTPYNFRNAFILTSRYESGGAGLITTAADYGKFVSAMSTAFTDAHPILKRESIEQMRTPQLSDNMLDGYDPNKVKMGYNYGLGVRTMCHPKKSAVGEFGWDGAAGSHGMIDPDNQIAMVYMIQCVNCTYSYEEMFPTYRDMIYEILLGK